MTEKKSYVKPLFREYRFSGATQVLTGTIEQPEFPGLPIGPEPGGDL